MRDAARSFKVLLTAALGLTAISIHPGLAAENPAGHDIADRFAKEAEKAPRKVQKPKRDPDQRKVDESEMLTRARAEAEQRRTEAEHRRVEAEAADRARDQEAQRLADEAAHRGEEAARISEQERRAADDARRIAEARKAEDARQAELARVAHDNEMARRAEQQRLAEDEARKIAEARKAEDLRQAEIARLAEIDRQRIMAEAKRQEDARQAEQQRLAAEAFERERQRTTELKRQAEAAARADAARRAEEQIRLAREQAESQRQARLAAERDAEARRITESLRQAETARADRERNRTAGIDVNARSSLGARDVQAVPAAHGYGYSPNRVTILLIMQPGNYGIRRHKKTADPLICGTTGCYVSEGPEAPAHFQSGRRALGFSGIFGERAGACRNSLGCVFRDVDLATLDGLVQPVDMHVLKHDRRQGQRVGAPSDCRVTVDRLQCRTTIEGGDYVMWIVPESVASAAGPVRLERALEEGLPPYQHASLGGR